MSPVSNNPFAVLSLWLKRVWSVCRKYRSSYSVLEDRIFQLFPKQQNLVKEFWYGWPRIFKNTGRRSKIRRTKAQRAIFDRSYDKVPSWTISICEFLCYVIHQVLSCSQPMWSTVDGFSMKVFRFTEWDQSELILSKVHLRAFACQWFSLCYAKFFHSKPTVKTVMKIIRYESKF